MELVVGKRFAAQGIKISATVLSRLQIHQAMLLRLAMVTGVLFVDGVIGVLAVKRGSGLAVFIAGIPFLLLGLQLVLRRLDPAPLIILLAATATRWYVSNGITPALLLTALFSGIWLVREAVFEHRLELVKSPVMKPTLVFILVAIISWPWGRAMADPLLIEWPQGNAGGSAFGVIQVAQLAVFVLAPAALILTANLITTKQHLRTLVHAYLGLTTLGILAEVLRFPVQVNLWGLTSMWAISLLYGQLLFNDKIPAWLRLVFVATIGLWLYKRFYIGVTWKSGWLPAIVAVGAITLFRSKKAFFLIVILSLILAYVSLNWWEGVWAEEYSSSLSNRLGKWIFLFGHHSTLGHWLLGTGPFGYALYFMTYFPNNAASTHSGYMDLFLQLGAVGCVIFVWLIGAIAWVGYRLCRNPMRDRFMAGFAHSVLGGLVGLLAAMFLGDWFIPFVLNQGLHGFSWTINSWIFLGALVAVPRILERQEGRTA